MIRLIPHPRPVVDHGARATTTYQPFLDEATSAVGYKVMSEGRPTRWIYLNPSNADGEAVPPTVFVYIDEDEHVPTYLHAAHFYDIWDS